MSLTDLEYRIANFHRDHLYDAFANPDKVGLGQCRCGEDMYYCDHAYHYARELIKEFNLVQTEPGLTGEVRFGLSLVPEESTDE